MSDVSKDFTPDWSVDYDKAMALQELGIEITGEGWYLYKDDALLAIKSPAADSHYRIFVWNGRNPSAAFGWVASAPTRLDARVPGDVWPVGAKVPEKSASRPGTRFCAFKAAPGKDCGEPAGFIASGARSAPRSACAKHADLAHKTGWRVVTVTS